MYIPKHFEQPSIEAMHELLTAHPFATLITNGSDGLCANHIPMLFAPEPQLTGSLLGHVSRANPVWREIENGAQCMVIFHGPDAYISPSCYPSKQETGKVVPTWNYATVHVHGQIRVIHDKQWLKTLVEDLTKTHEASFEKPWALSDAPVDYVDDLLNVIVGIEIVITKMTGKWKISQNRTQSDQEGVVNGLHSVGCPDSIGMLNVVEKIVTNDKQNDENYAVGRRSGKRFVGWASALSAQHAWIKRDNY